MKTQQETYEAALEHAYAEGLRITLLESWGAHVVNPAHDGYYTVRFHGHAMTCNCPAGQRSVYCKHRAAVRSALLLRAKQAQARRQREAFAANVAIQAAKVPAWMMK